MSNKTWKNINMKYLKNLNDYQTFQEIKEDNFDYCDILKLNNCKKDEIEFIYFHIILFNKGKI